MATDNPPNASSPDGAHLPPKALVDAMAEILRPLARLAVAKGLPFGEAERLLKRAFVEAALAAHPRLPPHRAVSRIATVTGINRREVTRLTQDAAPAPARPPVAAEVFARWISQDDYRDPEGQPRALPRLGPAPSFESLAQSVTRDVHPRSVLEELMRLGLVNHDVGTDQVRLLREAFVPRGDQDRMMGFLGDNVGDHFKAAVANVLADGAQHFEQAVFADELSAESLQLLRQAITAQWQELAARLVPQLQDLIDQDRATGRAQDQRVRIGLYSFSDRMNQAPAAPGDPLD